MYRALILILMIVAGINATAITYTDTVQLAKKLRDTGKYKQASTLLKVYSAHYPKDVNALWLYAQTEFWRRHLKLSQKLYETAIKLQPEKDYLNLDYAHALLNMGEWKKADKVVSKIEQRGKTYSDLLLLRAKVSYFNGDQKKAKADAKTAITANTESAAAKQLYTDVMNASSPWLKLGTYVSSDNQPTQVVTPSVEAGIYLHMYSSLQVAVLSPVFVRNSIITASQTFTIGNTSSFSKIGLLIKANVGIAKFAWQNKTSFTGDLSLQETFIKHLVFDAQLEYKPYLFTYTSIDTALSTTHITSSLGWNDQNFINGKAGFDINVLPGKDYVYSIYGYVYAPPIKFSFVRLSFGYSYNYSTSKVNDYISASPLDTIIKHYKTNSTIAGLYNPYFTPNGQNIHSALIYLKLNPLKNIEIGTTGSIGFYAYTQNPYLYLNKNSNSDVYIASSFARETFIPVEAGAYINWSFAKRYSIKAEYKFRETYFYTSHTAGISFKMNFWK